MNMQELNVRLGKEGFKAQFYCIGAGWHRLENRFALDRSGDLFEWFYVERGERSAADRTFSSETEACEYAYKFLLQDKGARSHMIGMFKDTLAAQEFIARLRAAGIESTTDSIPYGGLHDRRQRVSIYGTDIFKYQQLLQQGAIESPGNT